MALSFLWKWKLETKWAVLFVFRGVGVPKVGGGGGDGAKLAAQGVYVGSSRGGGGLHEDGGVVGRLKVCLGEDSLGGACLLYTSRCV